MGNRNFFLSFNPIREYNNIVKIHRRGHRPGNEILQDGDSNHVSRGI